VVPAATHVACASTGGRILTFEISALKVMANGGRGGKERDETLEIRSLNNARAARGRKGKAADLVFKPNAVTGVE
jgi:topoisomerase-4 subunit A